MSGIEQLSCMVLEEDMHIIQQYCNVIEVSIFIDR